MVEAQRRFLRECLPGRTRQNTLTILRLALYSRTALQELRRETGIRYDHLEKGILHIHTDARESIRGDRFVPR